VELKEGCNHVTCACKTHFCFVCGDFVRDGEGHWRREGGYPRFGHRGAERAIYDDRDFWDDNGDLGDEDRARVLQDRKGIEEEGLRRAFKIQMRMVDEVGRDLEVAEARRLRDRERQLENGKRAGSVDGDVNEQRRLKRRSRRRPHEGETSASDDERLRRERRGACPRRMDDDVPGPA